MSTLHDPIDLLRDVLAEEPDDLRAPDLDAVRRDAARTRRRRTALAAGSGVIAVAAAASAVVALVPGPTPGGTVPATGGSADGTAEAAARTRTAVDEVRRELSRFTGLSPLGADEDSYVVGTPDADDGVASVPRGDAQWARVLWWRFDVDLSSRSSLYVLVDAAAGTDLPDDPGSVCTNALETCAVRRVDGGRVAVERGAAALSSSGPGEALRVTFAPTTGDRSWVLVELRTRTGEPVYRVEELVDLVTDALPTIPAPVPGPLPEP